MLKAATYLLDSSKWHSLNQFWRSKIFKSRVSDAAFLLEVPKHTFALYLPTFRIYF